MHPKSKHTRLELLQVCGIGIVLACLHHWFADEVSPSVYKDEPRYINYALSMVQHGTFGISHDYTENVDNPGAANTPAYPLVLAASNGHVQVVVRAGAFGGRTIDGTVAVVVIAIAGNGQGHVQISSGKGRFTVVHRGVGCWCVCLVCV